MTTVAAAAAAAHVQVVLENVKITGVNWYRLSIEDIACKAVMSEGTA